MTWTVQAISRFAIFNSPRRAALWFTIGVLAFEALCLHVGYADLASIRLLEGNLRLLETIAVSVASTALVLLFVHASFRTSRPLRVPYFMVFCLALAAEYGYQYAFGRFSEVPDYEVALFAINSHIFSNAVATYINPLCAVPCIAYGLLLLMVDVPASNGRRSSIHDALVFGMVIAAFATLLTVTAALDLYHYPSLSMAASFRTLASIAWLRPIDPGPREGVAFGASAQPRDNIVFIVDESVRGDHLSVNGYGRGTTPFLDELMERGEILNWGVAASTTTCSVSANRLLLTGGDATRIWSAPSIFQYAKAMRYRTYYLDGQMTTLWNGTGRDRSFWDEWMTANTFRSDGLVNTDSRIAAKTADIVRHSVGNFIWINKFGVHTSYDLDYPESAAVWTPVYGGRGVPLTPMIAVPDLARREALINSYDNAIRWNLETFFRRLLEGGVPPHTTFVYTSDHGQTLSEHGERHSHCGTSKTEATVPLFIIARVGSLRATDTTYKASHSNIFATLLDLMGFPENERHLTYDVSLLKARAAQSRRRTYLVQSGSEWQVHEFDGDH